MPSTPTPSSINTPPDTPTRSTLALSISAQHDAADLPPPTTTERHFAATTTTGSPAHGNLNSSASRRERDAFGSTPIHRLPTESLSHIFAHLPPATLGQAQLVCKHWREVIDDDASWRSAFEIYYGILDEAGVALGRRLEPASWRAEYVGRVFLLSRWTKSRTPSVTHDPQLGPISSLHIAFPRVGPAPRSRPSTPSTPPPSTSTSLLSISLLSGRAVLSDPFTGKVARTPLAASPTDNFGQPLHPHLPLLSASSFTVSPDSSTIVWGMGDGSFRIVDSALATSLSARAWAGVREDAGGRMRAVEGHRRRVGAVAFDSRGKGEKWASAGDDGAVGIWSAGRRIWEASLPEQTAARTGDGVVPKACLMSFDETVGSVTVVVGMEDGVVHVWTGIALAAGVGGEVASASTSGARYSRLDSTDTCAIDLLVLDVQLDTLAILVHRATSPSFDRYTLSTSLPPPPPRRTIFGHRPDYIGALTAFAHDFSAPPPLPAPTPLRTAKPAITGFESYASINPPSPSPLPTSLSAASIDSLASISTVEDLGSAFAHGANGFGRRKYVVAGDAQGRVFIWDWEVEEGGKAVVEPRRMMQGFQSKVTALAVSDVAVFVGGLDGALRVYDTLTSTLLRAFKDRAASRLPARMLAQGLIDDEDRWKVSAIRVNRESVVAAIGGRVLAWRVEAEVRKRKSRGQSGRMSARGERVRSEYDLRLEVRESLSTLSSESSSRVARLSNDRRVQQEFGLPPSLDNMTEDEAVAFAMMLSAEEAHEFESRPNSDRTSPAFGAVGEDLLEMDGLSLDDEGWERAPSRETRSFGNRGSSNVSATEDNEDEDAGSNRSTTGSYSHSLSVPSSPFLRGSSLGAHNSSPSPARSWRPSSQPHSAPYSPSGGLSTSNHKLQLSPRLGPTYGEANAAATSPIPELDMRAELWPAASSTSASPSPLPRQTLSGSTSTNPSTPVRRGWNDIARSASASPSPLVPEGGSGLTRRLLEEGRRMETREEEELRFAIELSLAEELSRQQGGREE